MAAPARGPNREELERRANQVRAQLFATLEALDQRRHELADRFNPAHLRRYAVPAALAAGALVGCGIALSAYCAHRRRQHINRERWLALQRMWWHPERVAC